MNKIYIAIAITVGLFLSVAWANAPLSKATTQEKQASLTPKRALELLKEGNKRFVNNTMRHYDFAKEMKITSKQGQHPLAVMLSCIDSRSIPDFLFDQGLGNLFVSRIAGNVADPNILGSMEFATTLAGAKLIVVMGHTHCGAIAGACATRGNTELTNLNTLLRQIKPAVDEVKKTDKNFSCDSSKTIDEIAKQNVLDQLQYISDHSAAIAKLIENKKIYLVGAMHDISQGTVVYFDMKGQPL